MRVLYLGADEVLGISLEHALRSVATVDSHVITNRHQVPQLVRAAAYDLVVLDMDSLPSGGFGVLREVQQARFELPIIACSIFKDADYIAECLEKGADDYLVKPPRTIELRARIHAVRRRFAKSADRLVVGKLVLEVKTQTLWTPDTMITLTRKEYAFMELLFRRQGEVVDREDFHKRLFGGAARSSDALAVHALRLRDKLARAGGFDSYLKTIRGEGFRLAIPEDERTADAA